MNNQLMFSGYDPHTKTEAGCVMSMFTNKDCAGGTHAILNMVSNRRRSENRENVLDALLN